MPQPGWTTPFQVRSTWLLDCDILYVEHKLGKPNNFLFNDRIPDTRYPAGSWAHGKRAISEKTGQLYFLRIEKDLLSPFASEEGRLGILENFSLIRTRLDEVVTALGYQKHQSWVKQNGDTCKLYTLQPYYPVTLRFGEGGEYRLNNEFMDLSLAKRAQLISVLISDVARLHQSGLIHCDIKPQNIRGSYDENGNINRLYLIDLQDAIKPPNEPLGPHTALYAQPPEDTNQDVSNGGIKPRFDVFSLAMTITSLIPEVFSIPDPQTARNTLKNILKHYNTHGSFLKSADDADPNLQAIYNILTTLLGCYANKIPLLRIAPQIEVIANKMQAEQKPRANIRHSGTHSAVPNPKSSRSAMPAPQAVTSVASAPAPALHQLSPAALRTNSNQGTAITPAPVTSVSRMASGDTVRSPNSVSMSSETNSDAVASALSQYGKMPVLPSPLSCEQNKDQQVLSQLKLCINTAITDYLKYHKALQPPNKSNFFSKYYGSTDNPHGSKGIEHAHALQRSIVLAPDTKAAVRSLYRFASGTLDGKPMFISAGSNNNSLIAFIINSLKDNSRALSTINQYSNQDKQFSPKENTDYRAESKQKTRKNFLKYLRDMGDNLQANRATLPRNLMG